MIRSIVGLGAVRRGRALGALVMTVALLMATAQAVAAAVPSNDLVSAPTQLALGVAVDYNSADATISASDPTSCSGSHGDFPGPYYASVWFSYTAKGAGQLSLSAPTTQGDANDFLAISFVYQKTASGMTLIDCTAYGNDATWPATPGATYLIMEAGLDSAVTEAPELSDRGGHGTIAITRSANEAHYSYVDRFTYSDCGFTVNGQQFGGGTFHLRPGHQGDATPYLFDNYEWHIVSTNPANGKWFREDGQGQYRDLHITRVEGTVYTFVSEETGRPYTLTDMNGNKVFFDRGRLLTTFQVDTKGDDDLSNDEFIDGSFQLLADNGSHPFWHFEGEWCDVITPLIG
jgi:hypothetical protein